ncbi:MAG: cytochrome P450 [Novosphingobium sp.]
MADFEFIDYFTDPAAADDNAGYCAQLRAIGPVVREPYHGAFMVTGYAAAVEVLAAKSGAFSSAVTVTGPIPPLPFAPEGDDIRAQLDRHRPDMPWTAHLATFDGTHHAAHRALLAQLLTHSRLKKNADFVAGLVVNLTGNLIDRGGCEITRDFAHALSTLVIADLLGIPENDRDGLVQMLGLPPTQLGGDEAAKVQADPLTWLHARFKEYLEDRIAAPQDDMLTGLVQSVYKDGSKPDIDELARLASFLFGAGQDTSARLVAFSFRVLGDRPDLQDRLRAQPELIPDFIEEVLRLEVPTKSISRLAVEPVTIGEVAIPAGAVVTVNLGGANRDPAKFANPDRFELGRANGRDHLSFSRGAHGCIGAPLARLEVRLALEQFLKCTSAIRISPAHHGPPEARRYAYEPTYLLSGLQALHVEWDRA